MTISLVLVLVTIAGLGLLALLLILFGSMKKQQAKYAKDKIAKTKKAGKNSTHEAAQHAHREPFIVEEQEESLDDEASSLKAKPNAQNKVDPAIDDLGFNALDDLLPDAAESKVRKNTPAEFNKSVQKKAVGQDILVLHVMAPESQPFLGYELLQAVTSAGLRFGKMDIFHYLHDENPKQILFSLCAAVEPGSFDIANMGALICPGLSLFMRVSDSANPKLVSKLMLETAEQLAQDLSGIVCDEKRQPLTDEKLHLYLETANQSR